MLAALFPVWFTKVKISDFDFVQSSSTGDSQFNHVAIVAVN